MVEVCGLDFVVFGKVVWYSDLFIGGVGVIMFCNIIVLMELVDLLWLLLEYICGLGEKDLSLVLVLGEVVLVDLLLV